MSDASAQRLPTLFKRIGWSNLFAQFAEQIALAAAPLIAVLVLAAGPSETGWLQTAQTLPFLLLSIPAGLIVDRASRRTLLIGAESLNALSLITGLLLLTFGALNLPLLAFLGFVGAMGTVCYSVAGPALIPAIVPRAQLGEANRWLELARSAAYAGGPALGGALVGWAGASTAYAIATALSLLAIALMFGLPRDEPAPSPRKNLLQDLTDGAKFIIRHDLLRPILITAIFFNTSWFVLQAIYVAYAVQNLGLTATEVGVTLGIYGVGMVLGAGIAPLLSRRCSFGTMIILGPLGGFVAAGIMLLTLWFPSVYLVGLSFLLFGGGPTLWVITTITLRQAVTPNAMIGRVSALIMTVTFGARPVGALIGASVAARFGAPACLVVSAAGFLIQLVVICISQVPRLKELPEAA